MTCASLYWSAALDGSIQCKRKWCSRNYRLKNVSGFVSATGKCITRVRYKSVGEKNLDFSADGGHFKHL
jgi:hypothetical protein